MGYAYYDYDDEMPDDVMFDAEDENMYEDELESGFDNPEDFCDEEESLSENIVDLLRIELKKLYCDRDSLMFSCEGVEYEGIPMLELNPDKFVFEVDIDNKKKLKSFVISDITII